VVKGQWLKLSTTNDKAWLWPYSLWGWDHLRGVRSNSLTLEKKTGSASSLRSLLPTSL